MTTSTVIVLIALAVLTSSSLTASLFLVREIRIVSDHADKLEVRLDTAQRETLSEIRASNMAIERVAYDQMALESKRIESGRLQIEEALGGKDSIENGSAGYADRHGARVADHVRLRGSTDHTFA